MPHPPEPVNATVVPVTASGSGAAPVPYTAVDRHLDDRTRQMIADSVPDNTSRTYKAARAEWLDWCVDNDRVPLPATPETLTEFVRHLIDRDRAPATISSRVGAIRTMHRLAGHRDQPAIDGALQLLRGYKRTRAQAGRGQREARPITRDDLVRMVGTFPTDTYVGLRNRLVLVLGFAMMARQSEVVSLHLGDIATVPDGLEVTVRTSKTDKDSAGRVVPLPPASLPAVCPVTAYTTYRARLGELVTDPAALEPTTPLLRSVTKHGTPRAGAMPVRVVWEIVRTAITRAGIPDPEAYSPHSLRAGGLTAALQAGIPVGIAARHGGWSPTSPVVMKYARAADRWRDNAMRGVL
ncbi:tyrosine-type recombinase/integrase [Pseudonocardia sp. NPDC049635]|uniref:tyrosine-type recombinase/integrase n=1 Tax=Pseudonocardia sp. NPDC049635 TaxID=3155506 RepID=UPI0033E0D066